MGCGPSQPSNAAVVVPANGKAENPNHDSEINMMPTPYIYDDTTLNIFISYCWKCRKKEVRDMAKYLAHNKKMNVWIDVEQMYGSTVDRMSEGVKTSDIVIIFFSDAYQNSENCRIEVELASEYGKLILYVRMQKDFVLSSWLAGKLASSLLVDYKDDIGVEEMGDQIVAKLYELFDPYWKDRFKNFKTVGIESERFSEKCFQKLDFEPKLKAIKNICQTREAGILVLSGDVGVGKTNFVSLLLLRPENQTFLAKECSVRAALWLNCYSWRDENKFLTNAEAKAAFETEFLNTFARTTRRKLQDAIEEHVRVLKDIFHAAPIIIFDDVFHLSLLAFIRSQCKSLPCIAITRTQFLTEMQSQSSWNQLAPDVELLLPMTNEKMAQMLQELFELQDLDGSDLQKLAESCKGLPGQAHEIVANFKNKESPAKKTSKPVAVVTAPNMPEKEASSELIFVEVPDFDNYFVRPEEEDAVRNGIEELANKKQDEKGCFVVEGCGGIGKSTLISHVLRDPKYKPFFQEKCNLKAFVWLNCYAWRDGFEQKSSEQKDAFLAQLLALGAKADPSAKDGLKTLKNLLEHFTNQNLKILFVLDDVFHYSVIDCLLTECPSVLCCAVTRDASSLAGSSFDPFLKIRDHTVSNPFQIGYLDEDRVLEALITNFNLKDKLKREQFLELARRCCGMPLIISLTGGQFRNCRDGQYQRAFKKLVEEAKLSSFQIGKTGRGEETANQLFDPAWQTLTLDERKRYYVFLLFNPVEYISDSTLKLLWDSEGVESVRRLCTRWERLSLLKRTTRPKESDVSYVIHQILHELAAEKAAKDLEIQGQTSKLFLSKLRIRILVRRNAEFDNEVANLLATFQKITLADVVADIMRLIQDEAMKEFLPPATENTQLPCGLNPNDYEATLVSAAGTGHLSLTQYLLSCGCSVNSKNVDSATPLMKAASQGDLKIVEFLVSKGADVDAVDKSGLTPLMWSSFEGHDKVADFLLSKGAKIDAVSQNGETSLIKAASQGHDKVVNLLLAKSANIEATDNGGGTALIKAAQFSHEKVVELLINKGAQIDTVDSWGKTALLWAARNGLHRSVDLLISKSAKIDVVDKEGKTALMMAALGGHEKAVDILISKEANVNSADKSGETALMMAIKSGCLKVVETLLSKGANIKTKSNRGTTALIDASTTIDDEKVVELLVSKGSDINAADNSGKTALMWAASMGREGAVKVLLANGANVHARDNDGKTALLLATENSHENIVRLLS